MRIRNAEALRYHSRWVRSKRALLPPGLVAVAGMTVACASANPPAAPESTEARWPGTSINFGSWLQEPDESILLTLEGVNGIKTARDLDFTELPGVTEAWFSVYAMCSPDASMKIHYMDEAGRIDTGWEPICTADLGRNRVVFDPTSDRVKSIELVVEGVGHWALAVTDATAG